MMMVLLLSITTRLVEENTTIFALVGGGQKVSPALFFQNDQRLIMLNTHYLYN